MKEEKSKSKLKIKIDPDQIIDTSNFIIPQNKLTCKICYCVLINPKICYNKKCGQICCNDCIVALIGVVLFERKCWGLLETRESVERKLRG